METESPPRSHAAVQRPANHKRVGLVCMPFASTRTPSIQLGLLQALAERAGWLADSLYLNLPLAATLGFDLYEDLCKHRGHQLGDWLFAHEAFLDDDPDPQGEFAQAYSAQINRIVRPYGINHYNIVELRRVAIQHYLDHLEQRIVWSKYDVIGFTSTFQQTTASIALARRIKAQYPDTTVIFGGANCDDEMGLELLRISSCIDYVFMGEADASFPAFLEQVVADENSVSIPGVIGRQALSRTNMDFDELGQVRLDDLPVPNYRDYFSQLAETAPAGSIQTADIQLPFESSRGCWWGQKHHCTFCGLNGKAMAYRAKSPERLVAELSSLADLYGSLRFSSVDNIIDHNYLRTLLPKLASLGVDYDLFYEVKANQNRESVGIMRAAGLRRVQPGIESLSTEVLKGMRKGIDLLNNVNFLRWARYYGIQVAWNILYGFPDDERENYRAQTDLIPLLHHLEPPAGMNKVWLERFSPLYTARDRNYTTVSPEASYRYVFPAHAELDRLAYFFDYTLPIEHPISMYEDMGRAIDRWRTAWRSGPRPELRLWRSSNFIHIEDTRSKSQRHVHRYDGWEAKVYQSCLDRPFSAEQVQRALGLEFDLNAVQHRLLEFRDAGLVLEEGGKFLALALPV